MILTRLPEPHLGTTTPINDYPRPPMIARRLANDNMLAISTRSPAPRR
jgi:hypothetical protein